eukprot:8758894-Alexandrium_andersonii.AAC.1
MLPDAGEDGASPRSGLERLVRGALEHPVALGLHRSSTAPAGSAHFVALRSPLLGPARALRNLAGELLGGESSERRKPKTA